MRFTLGFSRVVSVPCSFRLLAVIAFPFGLSCSDSSLQPAEPNIIVCRSMSSSECGSPINLGALSRGDLHAVSIALRNVGGGDLDVSRVELVRGSGRR